MEKIYLYEQELLAYATQCIERVHGLRIIGTASKKGAIISFVLEGAHALDVGTMLDLQGIAVRTGHHCAEPVMDYFKVKATARISFAFYNTKEEITNFIHALQGVVNQIKD